MKRRTFRKIDEILLKRKKVKWDIKAQKSPKIVNIGNKFKIYSLSIQFI
jgi:hypothetical protein